MIPHKGTDGESSPRIRTTVSGGLIEFGVKPPRRNTKARRHGVRNLRALVLLPRGGNRPNSSI